jgi:hypothetical protein
MKKKTKFLKMITDDKSRTKLSISSDLGCAQNGDKSRGRKKIPRQFLQRNF